MGESKHDAASSLGLLLLRLGAGSLMLFGHGWGKIANYSDLTDSFPDPLGLGHTLSLWLAIAAEAGGSLLIMLGLATRLSALGLVITMAVAAFIFHASDPTFIPRPPGPAKELALVYLIAFTALLFTGAGKFSLDAALLGKRKKGGGGH